MCDCVSSTPFVFLVARVRVSALSNSQNRGTLVPISSAGIRSACRLKLTTCSFKPSSSAGPEGYGLRRELGFEEKGEKEFELPRQASDASLEKFENIDASGGPDKKRREKTEKSVEEADLVRAVGGDNVDLKRRRKQLMRRSNIVAKQVLSIRSALSLGFVSQLWVDTTSWLVLVVEVRPSLLSGESERFLLQDVNKVGDVVLVEDESVMENDFKMVGLETLVGYRVVTPGRRNIGKVRGYTFNINSGAVESLELDSFGISIIPSSLVSTYALLVEDVLEVLADTVIVHEAAASRIQRLTKGFWDSQNTGTSGDEDREYSDHERPVKFDDGWKTRRSFRNRGKSHSRTGEEKDDWDLPMDYL